MRVLLFLLQKEFKQIFRDKGILVIIFVAPLIQLLVLPLAADYEIKNLNLTVVDHDKSDYSRRLISKIAATDYFKITGSPADYSTAFKDIESGLSDLILEIPQGLANNLVRENSQSLFIAADAINGVKAGLGTGYLNQIIAEFNAELAEEQNPASGIKPFPVIEAVNSNRFNPLMNYNYFMVPGLLALLITIVGSVLSTLNIVREKELGTIEQINVTPIRKYQFILGKLIPFWIIGMLIFTAGLFGVGYLVYGIPISGGSGVLFAYTAVYLIAMLGFGFLISTYSETQQQATSVAFFFLMIFVLMSGLFTPIESMPGWAYVITQLNPVTWFVEVMRMIVLKGSAFVDIKKHFFVTIGFALLFNSWAVINYKKIS